MMDGLRDEISSYPHEEHCAKTWRSGHAGAQVQVSPIDAT